MGHGAGEVKLNNVMHANTLSDNFICNGYVVHWRNVLLHDILAWHGVPLSPLLHASHNHYTRVNPLLVFLHGLQAACARIVAAPAILAESRIAVVEVLHETTHPKAVRGAAQ